MKLKLLTVLAVTVPAFSASLAIAAPPPGYFSAPGVEDLLTGDTRLACEAILCLSSGDRPSECEPSIHKYFSIKHKYPEDTLKARRDFLNQCPASKDEGMPQLINALVNGAGRCDAAELNRVMRYTVKERVCTKVRFSKDIEECQVVTHTYIRPSKPQYCQAYFDHQWTTAGSKVRYVGEEKKGGRWVDVK